MARQDNDTCSLRAGIVAARELWSDEIRKRTTTRNAQFGAAFFLLVGGAIFLGLMRATRWIVTGR
jgi:hypothetical protein